MEDGAVSFAGTVKDICRLFQKDCGGSLQCQTADTAAADYPATDDGNIDISKKQVVLLFLSVHDCLLINND